MKKDLLFALLTISTLTLASCGNTDVSSQPTTSSSSELDSSSKVESSSIIESSSVTEEVEITIARAIELATKAGEVGTKTEYIIKGNIVKVTNSKYGEMTIKDDTGELYIYGVHGIDDTYFDKLEERPVAGDDIVLKGALSTFNGTPQMKLGIMQSFKHNEPEINEADYQSLNISGVRAASDGTLVKVSGQVTAITYANGQVPNGFFMYDTNESIYVFGMDAASQVAVGNTVTVAGSRTHYIAEAERTNALKYGYLGSNQIEKPILLSNDKKVSPLDWTNVPLNTVKGILDTPNSEDITSKVYKVNALIKKAPGNGFTNYYIDDLDGKTGSYTYTQCNGSDFCWLDEFDGKICSVYLSAINAKSTANGTQYRFLPLEVKYENYQFDYTKACEFAFTYDMDIVFEKTYFEADPAINLPTSYTNEYINIDKVEYSYLSSNNDIAKIENGVLHLVNDGEATITVTASYDKAKTISKDYKVTKASVSIPEHISINEALLENDGTEVIVEGIVSASLVNQVGFYITSNDGIIAVKCSSEEMEKVNIGDLVYVKGTRTHFSSKGVSESSKGTNCILDATIELNLYGNHYMDMTTFIESTLADFYTIAYDASLDYTSKVYIIKGYVVKEETKYYSNWYISDETGLSCANKVRLYSSSASQYNWLNAFVDEEVTLYCIQVNWNNKAAGCVIAVEFDDEFKVNSLNFK